MPVEDPERIRPIIAVDAHTEDWLTFTQIIRLGSTLHFRIHQRRNTIYPNAPPDRLFYADHRRRSFIEKLAEAWVNHLSMQFTLPGRVSGRWQLVVGAVPDH